MPECSKGVCEEESAACLLVLMSMCGHSAVQQEDENDDIQEVEGDSLAFVSQDIEQDAERNMEDFCSRHIESTVKGASHVLMSKRAAEQVPEPHLSPDVVATELVQHQEPSVAAELPNIHSTYNDSNSAGSEEDRECAGKVGSSSSCLNAVRVYVKKNPQPACLY